MTAELRITGIAGALRLGVSFLLCAALAGGLAAAGLLRAGLGVGIGFLLYAANLFFLYITLRALVGEEPQRRVRGITVVSSVGRLLLLGLALGAVLWAGGREIFFGTAGGLALAQISLFLRRTGAKGEA